MPDTLTIAVVGDHDPSITAHRAVSPALELAAADLGVRRTVRWFATDQLTSPDDLAGCSGIWCVPGSPYRSLAGALLAIRHARTAGVPFLGTCGGFQHAILEYAHSLPGWGDATHAELDPDSARAVISPLACSLVEVEASIRLEGSSRLARAYGTTGITEGYHCRFGIDPRFAASLAEGPLRPVGWDESGEIRAVELEGHPFFVGTLFQPERAALRGIVPPPVRAFVAATSAASSMAA